MGSLKKQRATGIGVVGVLVGGAIVLAVVAILLLVAAIAFDPFSSETVDRSGPAVLEQIRDLEEFTAGEGTFTQDVDLEEDAPWVPGFISGQRVVALVSGTVRATVDFGQLDESSVEVDEESNTIRITLPEPVLSDVDVDESATRIISRDRGLVDRIDDFFASNPTDDAELYQRGEEKIEEAARETDLVDEARKNTERWLTTFLEAAGFETVEVSWVGPTT